MRNLKRVLSLALACVMVIGMMVMTTGAAEIVDYDEITRTEAVDVMSALGVLEGDENGVFNPTGILTREQAAKIICYMLMGKDNAELLVGTSDFTDVAADRWSAPFISYCASLDIIAGNGDGTFNPTGELTGVAFAKMLLVALGYDAKVEGYVNNANWSTNIGSDAIDAGINVKGVALDAAVTRENAAQMALNTLSADMVYYPGGKGTEIITDGFSVIVGATPAVADPRVMEDAMGIEIDYTAGAGDSVLQFCEKHFSDLSKNTAELHGRQGYTWNLASKPAPISEFVVTDKVIATVNDGIADFDNAANKSHKDFVVQVENDGTDYTATFYINGASETITTATVGSFADTEVTTAIAKVGVIVEFIDTNRNNKADAINIINKNVVTLTGDAATKEVKNNDTQVVVPGLINSFSAAKTVKNVVGYEGLEKGDVILTYLSDGITYIELADVVSGKVTGTASGDKVVVNGEQLGESGLTGVELATWTDFKNSYDFYLDNTGAVVKYVQTTEEVADAYAVPVDISWVTGTGKIDEDNYAEAKLLFTDGTTKIVTVTKVDGKTIEEPSDSAASAATKVRFNTKADLSGTYAITVDTFYTYEIDKDGNYELTSIGTQNGLDYTVITNGKANFDSDSNNDGTGTDNNIGSTATTFIVKSVPAPGKVKYTVYNGINEVPNVASAAGTVIYDRSGLASYVYITAGTTSGSNNDYVVIVPNAFGSFSYTSTPNAQGNGIEYYTVTAIVNGVEQTIKLDSLSIADAGNDDVYDDALSADTLYQVATINAEGVITGMEIMSMNTGIQVVAGTLTDAAGANAYTTDAKTVIYYIDDEGAVTALDNTSVTADDTDTVYVVDANGDGKAELVYILQVEAATAAASLVNYTVDGVKQPPVAPGTGIAASTGEVVVITGIVVTNEGTYTIDQASFTASGTLTITLTAEDGTAQGTTTCTITFS